MSTLSTNSATSPTSPDDIRRQMRQIRRDLGTDVEELVVQAERLMDWRYYVCQYPWAMAGLATFIGYFIVPRRHVAFSPDERTLSRLVERLPVHVQPPPETKNVGIVGSLLNMGTNLVMRAALAYASQYAGKILGQQMGQQTGPQPTAHEVEHHG